ncbi:MAG: hypothetical protein WCQ47_02225 [bacterium]
MTIFLIICVLLCSIYSDTTAGLNLKRSRLKNGAVLISSSINSDNDSNMIDLFFKNGSTLKFNKKTGLSALAQDVISYRLKKLSKEIGFRYKSYLEWDYLHYALFFSQDITESDLLKVWSAFYGSTTIDPSDFVFYKNNVSTLIKYDFDHKAINSSMLGLMSHHKSVYNIGKYGSKEDVDSVQLDEFNNFLHCYINPNNSIIVLNSKRTESKTKNSLFSVKPCFMDERFSNEEIIKLIVPGRSVVYLSSPKKNFTIRLGFPSVSCSKKDSLAYDLVSQVLTEDEIISSLSGQIYISNDCYLNNGTLEIALANVKKDPDEIVAKIIQRISFLASNLEQSALLSAKNSLNKKFFGLLNDTESALFLIGKSSVCSGDYDSIINYSKKLETLDSAEVKAVLKNLNYENIFKMYLKQE